MISRADFAELRRQWLGDEIERLSNGIALVLHKNRHLADGDDCTLAELKSLVPDWEARVLFLTKT